MVLLALLVALLVWFVYSHSDSKSSLLWQVLSKVRKDHENTTYVDVVNYDGLRVYYPKYKHIELECGQMPSIDNESVIFCAEAAFTAAPLTTDFNYDKIVGAFITHGKAYHTNSGSQPYGRFLYYNGKPHFCKAGDKSSFKQAAAAGGCGFTQWYVIQHGVPHSIKVKGNYRFRCLCMDKNGRLCVADGLNVETFSAFLQRLQNCGMREAMYMDVGVSWDYAFYRPNNQSVVELGTYKMQCVNCTNWITFYK